MSPKRIFLDANILVTVLCNEYPRFGACARVLSLADDERFTVQTSPLCIAIGAYFAEKKLRNKAGGKKLARKKIELLAERLKITKIGGEAVRSALANRKILDLEDGFQYYSAMDAKCEVIVSYDKRDFHFSTLEVLDAQEFLFRYVVGR
ncbi:MAG TPA: PIN domain-containing protein [Flavobacteriales bacterium]|jgi:predicted nucleic acid-binding protein|nr:PIN domain-containing protein [Flavobacteriales bacterium]MBP9176588.1 PIN domain-containing protein [Flavobacteriales bacterium]HQW05167.1 PIN domain-containing protein [Flavobacteriales bacterium]HQW98986.1 PIN domain-containing protein [Flavobacteriales bacterium]HQY00659.1 PIN domain-containing protein [Flavobacteriales bacterium]